MLLHMYCNNKTKKLPAEMERQTVMRRVSESEYPSRSMLWILRVQLLWRKGVFTSISAVLESWTSTPIDLIDTEWADLASLLDLCWLRREPSFMARRLHPTD